jgi:hypothetical protein
MDVRMNAALMLIGPYGIILAASDGHLTLNSKEDNEMNKRKTCKCGGDLFENVDMTTYDCSNTDCPYITTIAGTRRVDKVDHRTATNTDERTGDLNTEYCLECGSIKMLIGGCKMICTNPSCPTNEGADVVSITEPGIDSVIKHTDERAMVEGLEGELLNELRELNPGVIGKNASVVNLLSALIYARIELNRVQMLPIVKINFEKSSAELVGTDSTKASIDSSLELEDLPAFLPLTKFTPEQYGTIRNGDRFNVGGKTMHVRFEKEYISGLRSLKVVKGSY